MLYRLSDFLFIVLYYIIGYRKGVASENIAKSFPGISLKERKRIIRGFYRNLCDIIVEGFKGFTITENS
ncbi:MAG: hypothetical protein COA57_11775 [Flavobacteriales bacterium]|nr:MAG: hypothetical protein COA57_11775 [Flavobacteriales bacterium]